MRIVVLQLAISVIPHGTEVIGQHVYGVRGAEGKDKAWSEDCDDGQIVSAKSHQSQGPDYAYNGKRCRKQH